jgi:hypothetical protein
MCSIGFPITVGAKVYSAQKVYSVGLSIQILKYLELGLKSNFFNDSNSAYSKSKTNKNKFFLFCVLKMHFKK